MVRSIFDDVIAGKGLSSFLMHPGRAALASTREPITLFGIYFQSDSVSRTYIISAMTLLSANVVRLRYRSRHYNASMWRSRRRQDFNCRSWSVFSQSYGVHFADVVQVAENMRAPLYAMSAGELGLTAPEVESNLTAIFELVTKWNAVLLLDEADIFLEQRNTHDLERNKLVSSTSSCSPILHVSEPDPVRQRKTSSLLI